MKRTIYLGTLLTTFLTTFVAGVFFGSKTSLTALLPQNVTPQDNSGSCLQQTTPSLTQSPPYSREKYFRRERLLLQG